MHFVLRSSTSVCDVGGAGAVRRRDWAFLKPRWVTGLNVDRTRSRPASDQMQRHSWTWTDHYFLSRIIYLINITKFTAMYCKLYSIASKICHKPTWEDKNVCFPNKTSIITGISVLNFHYVNSWVECFAPSWKTRMIMRWKGQRRPHGCRQVRRRGLRTPSRIAEGSPASWWWDRPSIHPRHSSISWSQI